MPEATRGGPVPGATPGGPVPEFCARLRALVVASGLQQNRVASRVGKSPAALSDLLRGRVARPPAWDDVRRIVECCAAAREAGPRAVAAEVDAWRHLHGRLVEVYEALRRLDPPPAPPSGTRTGTGGGPDPAAPFRVDPRSVPSASGTDWAPCLFLLAGAGDYPVHLPDLLDIDGDEAFLLGLRDVGHQVLDGFAERVRGADRPSRTVVCHAALALTPLIALLDVLCGDRPWHRPAPDPGTGREPHWLGRVDEFVKRTTFGAAPDDSRTPPEQAALTSRCRRALAGRLPGLDQDAAARALADLVGELAREEPELWLLAGQWRQLPPATGTALGGLAAALTPGTGLPYASDAARTLAAGPARELDRPLVAGVEGADGADRGTDGPPARLVVPRLDTGYVDPAARWAVLHEDAAPYADSWWSARPADVPLATRLAAHFGSVAALQVPLLVLGHPGAGKSLLTRVVMARLPATDFLPVRVELRSVAADAPVQRQIEEALRERLGEPLGWPELVRGAPGRIPVVLLDGFDELVQAAETDYWGYLRQVAEFQEREAAAGRPVAVVVTSRTVVMHRVQIPDGTRALCLEPFDEERRARWLSAWNDANRDYFTACRLRPLEPAALAGRLELASQPLLLLLLALYDSVDNGLARAQENRASGAELFEQLLLGFLRRQVRKRHAREQEPEVVSGEAEREIARLGVVALAMFNRGQQSVGADQVEQDARTLLGPDADWADDRAFGRFFFIHEAQARVGGRRRRTYEFLHATFSEYLVARSVWRSLLAASTPPAPHAPRPLPLADLLSFALLTDRGQVVERLKEMCAEAGPDGRRAPAETIPGLLVEALRTLPPAVADYAPKNVPPLTRLAHRTANLVLLHTMIVPGVEVSALLRTDDAPTAWRRLTGLWESQLDDRSWDDLTRHLVAHRTWSTPPGTPGEPRRDVRLWWAEDPARLGTAGPEWFAPEMRDKGAAGEGLARRAAFGGGLDQQLLLRGDGALPYRVGQVWDTGARHVAESGRSREPGDRMLAALVALMTPGHLASGGGATAPHTACLQALTTSAASRTTQHLVLWAVAAALVRDLPWVETREACALIRDTAQWGDRLRADEEVLGTLALAVRELHRRADLPQQEALYLDSLATRLSRDAGARLPRAAGRTAQQDGVTSRPSAT
ncbi:helix-turn-helix domain-containing protein [Streptomyces sp. NPDC088785]|uniref:helix-turn-helix domain-containing protein n=1 Tax=Streptomyces sp. NPDC088785 TaxID=3365897 RepID=UPI0037FCC723